MTTERHQHQENEGRHTDVVAATKALSAAQPHDLSVVPIDRSGDEPAGKAIPACPSCQLSNCVIHTNRKSSDQHGLIEVERPSGRKVLLNDPRWHCARCGLSWDRPFDHWFDPHAPS